MLRFSKYINYKNILLKIIGFIFYHLCALYVYPSENVTSQQSVFNSSIFHFNFIGTQSYSIKEGIKNSVLICTDAGILTFDGFSWSLNPVKEPVFDLFSKHDTIYYLSSTYMGIIPPDSQNTTIKKIYFTNTRFSKLNPPKLFKTENNIYIYSEPNCYLLDSGNPIKISSEFSDMYLQNNILYGLSSKNILYKIDQKKVVQILSLKNSSEKFKFLTSGNNLWLKSGKSTLEIILNPTITLKPRPAVYLNTNTDFTFAQSNNFLFLSPNSNFLFLLNLTNGVLQQTPVNNPFITTWKQCYIDSKNNIWLLYNEGLIKVSIPELINGDFNTIGNTSLYGAITDETNLLFYKKKPIYQSKIAYILYFLLFCISIYLFFVLRKYKSGKNNEKLEQIIKERTAEILYEKNKTDELLANLLPKDTATELKNTGKASSQKFDMVTVLFSDIQGFTKIAEQLNPEKLIDQLDNFFFHFDSVVEKYNIEKIKTIGDAYMCAGGIPYKNRTNPVEVILAALEMQDYMRELKNKDQNFWDLRIGIHTGAVISGVVGHKRLSYDIWGDTVNTASRMESSGEAGKINISGHTFELVKDFFVCEYRGKMPVKYKGDIDMYFVKCIRPELSIDLKVIPNRKFFIQLQLLRLHDLEEFIIDRIDQELTNNYYFHTSKHTKDIYTQAELLGRAENISHEEMLLVRTSALLLDIGFISDYHNHINHSVTFAREILPKFKYSSDQTEAICNLLFATNTENSSPSIHESILIDARYNYFGRVDYAEKIQNLIKEIKAWVPEFNEKEFIVQQINRMKKFTFLTSTAKLLQEVPSKEQIKKLEELLK